ncbi:MAG: TonB family protein, partial [Candidatus Krumholzibacteriota bacterium]|nr:TonB family protein [Candidatus Krumholzibacteriota bacterium]
MVSHSPEAAPSVFAAIPARYRSVRLPGKALLQIAGVPLIERVYRQVEKVASLERLVVLTDDERILDVVKAFGGSCEMTPEDCASGTDRVAWAAVDLDLTDGRGFDSPEFQNMESPEEIELLDYAEFDKFQVRTEEKRREVPYSRDYVILKMIEPEYPEDALAAGIEGSVLVELLVGQSGNVEETTVLSRFGPASFEKSSLEAVRQFVFQPPVQGGRPATMQIRFVI